MEQTIFFLVRFLHIGFRHMSNAFVRLSKALGQINKTHIYRTDAKENIFISYKAGKVKAALHLHR